MKDKDARRQAARKKAKQKRAILITVCSIIAIAIVAFTVMEFLREDNSRVFATGGSNVTLNDDGTFIALLPHGVVRSGEFTETQDGNITIISFSQAGATAMGTIEGNVLTIPSAWDDGHGHPTRYTLR